MNEDRFDELLEKCESPIETKLLTKLYPHLSPSHARELEAQKRERITHDGTRIRLDFAFPDLRIAICCDGRSWHEGNPERFDKDRRESRELQLQSWTVLRFSGREINSDSEMVVETIQRAIKRREWYRNRQTQQQQARQQQRTPIPERAPADLRQNDLRQSDLRQNDLRQNDLRQNDLRQNDLRQNDLRQNDLRQNDLRQNDLRQNDLRQNDLRQNDLRQNNLRQNDLRQNNLRDNKFRDNNHGWTIRKHSRNQREDCAALSASPS